MQYVLKCFSTSWTICTIKPNTKDWDPSDVNSVVLSSKGMKISPNIAELTDSWRRITNVSNAVKCFTGNSICYTMLYNIKTLLPRFFENKMKCFTGNSICYTMLSNIKTLLPRFFENKMKCFTGNSICYTMLSNIKTLLPRFFGNKVEKNGFDIFWLF